MAKIREPCTRFTGPTDRGVRAWLLRAAPAPRPATADTAKAAVAARFIEEWIASHRSSLAPSYGPCWFSTLPQYKVGSGLEQPVEADESEQSRLHEEAIALPYYRVVLQRTTECVMRLDANAADAVTTEAFRREYGLPPADGQNTRRDPDPFDWHRTDRREGGGALVWADTGWTVVLASERTPGEDLTQARDAPEGPSEMPRL